MSGEKWRLYGPNGVIETTDFNEVRAFLKQKEREREEERKQFNVKTPPPPKFSDPEHRAPSMRVSPR